MRSERRRLGKVADINYSLLSASIFNPINVQFNETLLPSGVKENQNSLIQQLSAMKNYLQSSRKGEAAEARSGSLITTGGT